MAMIPPTTPFDASSDRVARLTISHPVELDPGEACRRLPELTSFGPPQERGGWQRHLTDLSFPMSHSGRTLVFRKAAYVDLGPVTADPNGCEVDMNWSSASFAPLFPIFAGRLTINRSGLTVTGVYAPPLGGVGLLIDATLLHFVARRTARWFLEELAAALTDS
jgi:hypothetical protein